eukprot:CAMPEP_0202462178 /NCGR_PEP_ID=MMETSP1360-20130828/52865_1 /ASSEMBLY_ACC=CAM_ASM_000848 /TAXON_ID=515479 /ORGANISM="Licmophora paradoxa, Strain CCMP2313" /LENGTH=253 /DNA_ID=CAMNT_0049084527 /DNA_START=36 /DNA_END=793 /DNA_ORIENTATION=+
MDQNQQRATEGGEYAYDDNAVARKRKRQNSEQKNETFLEWQSESDYVLSSNEVAMLDTLIRGGKKERGMMKDHPGWRRTNTKKMCEKMGMTISQSCSLRRHHIRLLNPYIPLPNLRLGTEENVRISASLFENCVARYLNQQRVQFWDEDTQKLKFPNNRFTPDFLLKKPIQLKLNNSNPQTIHWIEAKMFYGADSIPNGKKSAVGRIMHTAHKYRDAFGPGAIVFSYGCAQRMASNLQAIGVVALDAHPLNLS